MKRTLLALPLLVSASCTTIYFDFYTYRAVGTTGTGGAGGGGGTTSTGGAGGALLCAPGATQPCYDGPQGTEGVGLCQAGTQTCAPDGASWGACVGEVLPKPEDCATPFDEDCDGAAPSCKGALLWAKRFGDGSDQAGRGVATDGAGNVFVTGFFDGAADFGGGPLLSLGGGDIFLVKLDPTGALLWSQRFGDGAAQVAQAVAIDVTGEVVITGYFNGTVDFGGGPFTSIGGADVFVAKFDAAGAYRWSAQFGGSKDEAGQGIAVDASGNVLVTGYFNGAMNAGSTPLVSVGGTDVFVIKLGPDGTPAWSKRFGDTSNQGGAGIAADPMGNVVVTGYFTGSVDFDAVHLASSGGKDVFVAKLGADGSTIWAKGFGDAGGQFGQSIAADGAGNVLVAGTFGGTLDFGNGSGTLASAGTGDIFMAKLDPGGTCVWSRSFGDTAAQTGQAIAVDGTGNAILTGSFAGTVDFGGGPLFSAGVGDAFVAKYDVAGAHQWSKRFGDAQDQSGQGVSVDPAGNVLVVGQMSGTVDFGGGVHLTAAGGSDIFVAKFGP
jgi:hypothetical protein